MNPSLAKDLRAARRNIARADASANRALTREMLEGKIRAIVKMEMPGWSVVQFLRTSHMLGNSLPLSSSAQLIRLSPSTEGLPNGVNFGSLIFKVHLPSRDVQIFEPRC